MERRRMLGESGGKAIDLSMVNNDGSARASMTTANCYLVHVAGKYKLPLVYGNAIKDGEDNSVAYYPGENINIPGGARQFVNHNGDGITGPWITKSGTGVDGGMGLTASSAELLWQDAAGLISAVDVDGDYLTFTVGTFTGGNALIAVKDGSGTILWSWHIWATDETFTSTTAVNTGSHTYNVAAVNLGWVPTGGDGKQGYCTYYQWGRKEPFIPASQTSNFLDHTVYNIYNTIVTGINTASDSNIANNIKNPITCYYCNSTLGPVTTTYYNMWDAQNNTTNNVATATKKTIYDPCPPGFCIPTGNLWYYFGNGRSRSDTNWDSTNKGKNWTLNGANIYFPAVGYRSEGSGTLNNVGTDGQCWSATPNNDKKCCRLSLTSSGWWWGVNYRARSFPIRPVVEE